MPYWPSLSSPNTVTLLQPGIAAMRGGMSSATDWATARLPGPSENLRSRAYIRDLLQESGTDDPFNPGRRRNYQPMVITLAPQTLVHATGERAGTPTGDVPRSLPRWQ
jgi:hypothetical protein